MAALLFARAGRSTVLLEKHADFLRDFRGDTIHPSTLDVMDELGLLESFLKRPHQEVTTLAGNLGDTLVTVADFTHLPTRCKFVAFMPQWEFLNFLAEEAKRFPCFDLRMQARAEDLLWENGRVAGVRAQTPSGPLEIRADLTIAADGTRIGRAPYARARRYGARRADGRALAAADQTPRRSASNLRLHSRRPHHGADRSRSVLAVRVRHSEGHARRTAGRAAWTSFGGRLARSCRSCAIASARSSSWDDVKLLTVRVNRLRQWYRAGSPLHRRCRARDVADRRRRHQSRDSRCGRSGEHARRQALARWRHGARSCAPFSGGANRPRG